MTGWSKIAIFASFFASLEGQTFAASQKTSAYRLFDISCGKNERATGCEAPFKQCEIGRPNSIRATCGVSANYKRCSDFTWEKCCVTNCYIRNNKKMIGMNSCMDECLSDPRVVKFSPKAKRS